MIRLSWTVIYITSLVATRWVVTVSTKFKCLVSPLVRFHLALKVSRFAMIFTVLFIGALVWIVLKVFRTGQREKGLPPGPPTFPLLGNMALMPTEYPYIR